MGISCCATSADSSVGTSTDNALSLYHNLKRGAEAKTPLGSAIKRGLTVLGDALRLYGAETVVCSFNGGKDAVVILHLMRAALAGYNEQTGGTTSLRIIFFEMEDEFPEVDAFVRETIERYDLVLTSYADMGFAEGLKACIAEHGSRAFVLGTRKGDPNAKGQEGFSPSSDWMPPFMRVNPILHWDFAEVWAFLREYKLPYCKLYDDGYTSLGKTTNTARNPALLRADGSYGPAWELLDGNLEREGRISSSPPTKPAEPKAEARVKAETAALLIVGDEILGGKQPDTNTLVAARRLRAAGCSLRRVSVVPDEIETIVEELRRLAAAYDVVFTSGGLGPTHDDVTMKGVAAALGMSMGRNEQMASTIVSRYANSGRELAPEVLDKMANLPSGAVVRPVPGDDEQWPILQCANVFVLPGVPSHFSAKATTICAHFLLGATPVLARRVLLTSEEDSIVAELNRVVASHRSISFGSYPVRQGAVRTIITLEAEGGAEAAIDRALAELLSTLPEGAVAQDEDAVSNLASLSTEASNGYSS